MKTPKLLLLGAALFTVASAHAATYNWTGNNTGTGLVWTDGFGLTPGVAGDTFNLNTVDWTGTVSINPTAPSVTLGILNIGDTGTATSITLNANSSTFILDNSGSNAQINVTNSGAATAITTPLQLNSNLTVTNSTSLSLNGNITGYGGITKTGAGQLTIGGGTPAFAGNVDIQQGTLSIDLGARTLPSTASINIASGATFSGSQTNGNMRTFAGLTGAGTFTQTLSGGKTITINNAVANIFTGTINYSGTSTNTLTKANVGDFTLSGAGVWTVGGTATTLNLNGGRFILDSSGTNNTNRITDTVLLTLKGGELSLIGNGSAATNEILGAMTLGTGFGSKISVAAGTGQAASVTLASLAVTAGSTTSNAKTTSGGILFRGTALGTAAPSTPNVSNILFTAAPTLTGGGGSAGNATISILPYALGDDTATGLGKGLVTYDATNGIRLLDTTTEVSAYGTGTPANENQKITSSGTVAGQTVNSLLMASSGTTTVGTGNLTLGSGALVFTGSGSQAIANSGGFGLVVADKSAYVSVTDAAGVATLDGITITGSAAGYGLVKQGAGTLVLNGQVTGNAGYVVAAGTLKAGATNTLFRNASSLGVTLQVQNGATADMAGFAQSNAANGAVMIEQGGILTNTGANAEFTLTGGNSGTFNTSTISGLITDGTPGDGAATGLVSIKVSGADTKAITLTHGGHTLNNATVSSGNASNNTITFNSLTATDNNTIYGTVIVQKGGRIIANTISDGSNYSTTLGSAALDLGATGGSSATDSILTVNSKGATAALTNQTLTWTNNVTVGSGQTQGSIVVGSGDGGLSTGNTQQFGTLTISAASSNATKTFNSTSNNGYTTEFTGATTLTGNGTIAHTFNVAAGTLALNAVGQSGNGTKGLTKTGNGTMEIKGAGTYTGNTTVSAGTLYGSGATSLTTSGTLIVSGGSAGAAVLRVGSAQDFTGRTVSIITANGGAYQKDLASSAAYTTYGTAASSLGGNNTSATFLAGTAGAARNVLTSSSNATLALVSNDATRKSDVFSLSGTSTDIFVLQLSIASGITSGDALAWNNGGLWALANVGNSALGGSAILNYAGSFALSGASASAAYLGSFGYDTANNTVWAVLDHNSEFAIAAVPEPATWALLAFSLTTVMVLRRRRQS